MDDTLGFNVHGIWGKGTDIFLQEPKKAPGTVSGILVECGLSKVLDSLEKVTGAA